MMNIFLRAIGFSDYTNIDLLTNYFNALLGDAENYDETMGQVPVSDMLSNNIYQFTNSLPGGIGIRFYATKVISEESNVSKVNESSFRMIDAVPFVLSTSINSIQDLSIEKKYQGFSYLASCEHSNVGVTIIFRLVNPFDYMSTKDAYFITSKSPYKVAFSALSIEGTILLPISQTDSDIQKKYEQIARRSNLVASARTGDESAIQSLAFEDMDTYAKISNRIRTEDIYTIVESSFMPFGLETDLYSIIAEIVNVREVTNIWTNEEIYILTLDYNGVFIDTAINKSDIIGEPLKGRRFKGVLCLQGAVAFTNTYI